MILNHTNRRVVILCWANTLMQPDQSAKVSLPGVPDILLELEPNRCSGTAKRPCPTLFTPTIIRTEATATCWHKVTTALLNLQQREFCQEALLFRELVRVQGFNQRSLKHIIRRHKIHSNWAWMYWTLKLKTPGKPNTWGKQERLRLGVVMLHTA